MVHISKLLAEDLAPVGPRPVSLGFTHLNRLTGGLLPGRLLLIATAPGQGKTTYATQLAGAAANSGRAVQLLCPRETPRACAARLLAALGRVPLSQLLDGHPLYRPADQRAEQVRAHLSACDLDVVAGAPLEFQDHPPVEVFVIDDAHLGAPDTPGRLRAMADKGVIVIATIPDDLLQEDGDRTYPRLHRPWAEVCDLAVTLTWANDPDLPGEVDLALIKNRHGPLMDEVIAFQGHYARFLGIEEG